ncbi:MAG: phosphate permease, partial [Ignavibacteria bacterium]|nr:phosphate permease [Ignavibacteria bacterium]
MFDLVRASVNMMVASILIAVGTSFKLPLSTTYVTFMVAMSTSLVDGAWGRDSAVYRITGVFTVIGGWFFTGLAAFTVAMALSIFLGWAQTIGVIVLVAFAIFAFYRTNITHKANVDKMTDVAEETEEIKTVDLLFEKCNSGIVKTLNNTTESYYKVINLLIKEDFKELKKLLQASTLLEEKLNKKRNNINLSITNQTAIDSIEASHYYVLSLDYQKEIIHSITYLIEPVYSHVVNNHKPILKPQAEELIQLAKSINVFIKFAIDSLENNNAERLEKLNAEQEKIINQIKEARKNLIKSIKKNDTGNKA